jgi:hypothetical protein
LDRGLGGSFVSDIQQIRPHLPGVIKSRSYPIEGGFVAVKQADAPTLIDQSLGTRKPDPGSPAGDESDAMTVSIAWRGTLMAISHNGLSAAGSASSRPRDRTGTRDGTGRFACQTRRNEEWHASQVPD